MREWLMGRQSVKTAIAGGTAARLLPGARHNIYYLIGTYCSLVPTYLPLFLQDYLLSLE